MLSRFLDKIQASLPPTRKWSRFFVLALYFTILVFLYKYFNLTHIWDVFDLKLINHEFVQSSTNPRSLMFLLLLPIVLAMSTEFSAVWAIVLGGGILVLSIAMAKFGVGGILVNNEEFGYFLYGIFNLGFAIIVVSGIGIVLRFVIKKLNSRMLYIMGIIVIILIALLLIVQIDSHKKVSLEGCISSSSGGTGVSYKCFEELAKINTDPKICFSYQDATSDEKTRMLVSGFSPTESLNACIRAFAKVKKDLSICDLLPPEGHFRSGCYSSYNLQ